MSSILNKMPSLTGTTDKIKGLLFNRNFLIIMVVVAIFLGVAFYVYNTYIAPRINPDFVPNREFTTDDILKGITEIIPLAQLENKKIQALQQWALSGRIRTASSNF